MGHTKPRADAPYRSSTRSANQAMTRPMQIVQVGLSHKTAPIELREHLAVSEERLGAALQMLCSEGRPDGVQEGAIVSTCNRMEVYAVVADLRGQRHIREFLARTSGICETEFEPYLQLREDRAAVAHLCSVACGLDSMILGEAQIQGQIAQAHQQALCHSAAGPTINALFRTALTAGKRARTETDIARHAASISQAAVELAAQIFEGFTAPSILLVGAGEVAELAAKNLADRGVTKLVVVNRSFDRAARLAQRVGGEALAWELLPRALCTADIVISSTAAPQAILRADMVSAAMRVRHNRDLIIIDIAVPRDVDPEVGRLSNVFLYDIDDLRQVVDANLELRKREIARVEAIIDQEVAALMAWLRERKWYRRSWTCVVTSKRSAMQRFGGPWAN